jgi:hypothetical protein
MDDGFAWQKVERGVVDGQPVDVQWRTRWTDHLYAVTKISRYPEVAADE